MRIAFVGAGNVVAIAASALVQKGHEVVVIDSSRERIEELSDLIDCGFLHGDGARPAILRDVGPKETDVLFCMSDNDRVNIIAALVGRRLGFERVVTSIHDPELEPICRELGLEPTIVPARAIARQLENLVVGHDTLDLTAVLKAGARLFTFEAGSEDVGASGDLQLPERARVVCLYRDGELVLPSGELEIAEGDEVVVIAHQDCLDDLQSRWGERHERNE